MKAFLVIILLILPTAMMPQVVSGRVCNAEGEAIPFANVALRQKADSAFVDGTTTNHDGYFEIKAKDAENCFLQVSCFGYQALDIEIETSFLTITLNVFSLDEVTVTADRVKKNASSEVYYITDSLRKASANTLQLLDKLQGIKIDWATDAVKIGEYRDVPMMIEGRNVSLEYVRNLNPERIRRVEILRNPKGKYGDMPIVVNIILNNSYTGFDLGAHAQGMVSLRNKHSHHADGSVTFAYSTEKWNLYGDAGMKDRQLFEATSYEQIYKDIQERTSTEDDDNPNVSNGLTNQNFSAGADYKINPRQVVSLQMWADKGRGKDKAAYNNTNQDFLSSNISDYDASNITVGAFYRGAFNDKLHLSGDLTYNYYDVDENNRYTLLTDVSEQQYKGKKNFWRANADARYVWSDVLSSTIGYTFTDKDYTNHEQHSNTKVFSSEESRHEAYFSVSVNPTGNFDFVVGTNFMYIDWKNEVLSDGNFSWMPLAKAYWRPFNLMSISANYYCDVQHPNLDQQSVAAYQRNGFLWYQGNPELRARVMHYMEYRMELKNILQFTYLYKHSSHEITPWYFADEDRVIETLINADYIHQYVGFNGDYTLPHNIGIYFTANYQWYKRRAEGQASWRKGHTWYLDVTATWQVHKSVSVMSGYFLRYDKEPLLQGENYGQEEQLMLGINASAFKNKLSVILAMTIPTNAIPKRTYKGIYTPDYQYTTWKNDKVNNTIVQLGFRLNIGKGKVSKYQNKNNSETEK